MTKRIRTYLPSSFQIPLAVATTRADGAGALHEQERSRLPHHATLGFDEFPRLDRSDELYVELDCHLRRSTIHDPPGNSKRLVEQRQQSTAVHDSARVHMPLLRKEAELREPVLSVLPERTYQINEALLSVDSQPAVAGLKAGVSAIVNSVDWWEPRNLSRSRSGKITPVRTGRLLPARMGQSDPTPV
jgi:hypothetical protein